MRLNIRGFKGVNIMKIDKFINLIVSNAKTKKWLSCTEIVQLESGELATIGVKAYGRWVQRIECNGMRGNTGMDYKTVKAFREAVTGEVTNLLRANGYKLEA